MGASCKRRLRGCKSHTLRSFFPLSLRCRDLPSSLPLCLLPFLAFLPSLFIPSAFPSPPLCSLPSAPLPSPLLLLSRYVARHLTLHPCKISTSPRTPAARRRISRAKRPSTAPLGSIRRRALLLACFSPILSLTRTSQAFSKGLCSSSAPRRADPPPSRLHLIQSSTLLSHRICAAWMEAGAWEVLALA